MRELIHIVEFHDITSDKVEFCGALADWFVQLASRHQRLHRNIDLPKRLTSLICDCAALKEFLYEVLPLDEHLLRLFLLELV